MRVLLITIAATMSALIGLVAALAFWPTPIGTASGESVAPKIVLQVTPFSTAANGASVAAAHNGAMPGLTPTPHTAADQHSDAGTQIARATATDAGYAAEAARAAPADSARAPEPNPAGDDIASAEPATAASETENQHPASQDSGSASQSGADMADAGEPPAATTSAPEGSAQPEQPGASADASEPASSEADLSLSQFLDQRAADGPSTAPAQAQTEAEAAPSPAGQQATGAQPLQQRPGGAEDGGNSQGAMAGSAPEPAQDQTAAGASDAAMAGTGRASEPGDAAAHREAGAVSSRPQPQSRSQLAALRGPIPPAPTETSAASPNMAVPAAPRRLPPMPEQRSAALTAIFGTALPDSGARRAPSGDANSREAPAKDDGKSASAPERRAQSTAKTTKPQILLLVRGLGANSAVTKQAIIDLPKAVSLAFVPYGENVAAWAASAQKAGHEVLMQIPMEPADYPKTDPGPHTLLRSYTEAQNSERLRWLLARISAPAGVTNFLGGRFAYSSRAFAPVLSYLKENKLAYIDDGKTVKPYAWRLTERIGLRYGVADVILDTDQDKTAVQKALAALAEIARKRGFAIGIGHAFPATIETLKAWLSSREGKGFALVPPSKLAPVRAQTRQQLSSGNPS